MRRLGKGVERRAGRKRRGVEGYVSGGFRVMIWSQLRDDGNVEHKVQNSWIESMI